MMSPDGKPMQVAASALQAGGAEHLGGRIENAKLMNITIFPRIVNKS